MRAASRRDNKPCFDRLTFTVSRAMEYLSEKELSMQIGRPRDWWPIAIVKELIDNGLDAAEMTQVTPKIKATNTELEKWMPDYPSCPHWYTAERLRDLIAAIVVMERQGAKPMTLRGFLATFSGLQSTLKQRDVARAASLHGVSLADLVSDDTADVTVVDRLLKEMKAATRQVKSKSLGVIA